MEKGSRMISYWRNMNLKEVSQKLKNTRLFSEAQKVELFALLPEASEEDIRKLEAGIDAFDAQYASSIKKHSQEVMDALTTIMKNIPENERQQYQDEVDEIAMGLALLTPTN